jgi:uncharacterized protein (TIGR00369 family)
MSDTRERTVRWEDPLAGLASMGSMSGLEMLHAIKDGQLPPPPIAELMGFELVLAEEGRAVFALTPAEYHYNPIGMVHGGVASTLLDSAMGCAVQSTLPAGDVYSTVGLQVTFVRPLTLETGRVLCEGKAIHVGGRMALAEGRVEGEDGQLYAHGTTTCMLLRARHRQ